MSFDDFKKTFRIKGDSEMISVGGWVTEQLDGTPEAGDSFTYGDLNIKVLNVDEHRITEVEVKVSDPARLSE